MRRVCVKNMNRLSHTPKRGPVAVEDAANVKASTPPWLRVRVVQMRDAGASWAQIVAATGLAKTTCRRILQKERNGGVLHGKADTGGKPRLLSDKHVKMLEDLADKEPYQPDSKLVAMLQRDDPTFPTLSRKSLYNYLYKYVLRFGSPFRSPSPAADITTSRA